MLSLNKKTFGKILTVCTPNLVNKVFDDYRQNGGIITIDINCKDVWDVTDYLTTTSISMLEKLKVISTFDNLSINDNSIGCIIYQGTIMSYTVLYRKLNNKYANVIQKVWALNTLNQTLPVFDVNDIDVPPQYDDYTITKIDETSYMIEELYGEGYHFMDDELYPTVELAQKRIKELMEEKSGKKYI